MNDDIDGCLVLVVILLVFWAGSCLEDWIADSPAEECAEACVAQGGMASWSNDGCVESCTCKEPKR